VWTLAAHFAETVTDELDPKLAYNPRKLEQEWLRVNGARYAGQ
jgi:hypothetical protein